MRRATSGVVPTYIGGFMAFGWATDEPAHRGVAEAVLAERFAAAGLADATRYYTPEVHRAAFALPRFIRDLVDEATAGGG